MAIDTFKFEKIHLRITKKVYPTCCNIKKLVKLSERQERLIKDTSGIWGDIYNKGYDPIRFQSCKYYREKFLCNNGDLFDLLHNKEKEQQSISRKIDNIENKFKISMDQALTQMYLLNKGRGSVSY